MKNVQLTTEQAKQLYKTNPEYRTTLLSVFTDDELGIEIVLRGWEELDFERSYWVNFNGVITRDKYDTSFSYCHTSVPTEKHAKSMIAFAKLSMLMADLGYECKVDWRPPSVKYVILCVENRVQLEEVHVTAQFLAFKTEKVRDAFLRKHRQLINEYFMIDGE